jgi:radical SAM superfamily enzyme YgiQ (UPF0313 family)
MRVTLLSTYELGHQPLHVAAPAATLRELGHDVAAIDTSVDAWDAEQVVRNSDAVALSVPMHTAMRLAIPLARELRMSAPDLPIAFYGLYAPVSRDLTVGSVADVVFAGTYTPQLTAWVASLDGRDPTGTDLPLISLAHPDPVLPARDLLPPLDRYAHLAIDGERRRVGYVEATQGCLLECRHCPVPTVYGGRFRAVSRDAVLDDIAQLVSMGAEHITFGDPDFLNGPTHSRRLVEEMHTRWPHLTFDCTTKVDHILDNAELWDAFAGAGCVFVVSAFETTNDRILERLDKGHTTEQAGEVVDLLRSHGIEVRPSWMPFTPWTTVDDLRDVLDFVIDHDLVDNVEPIHYAIRLLLPEGSLLVEHPDLRPHLGPYDPERLTYTWTARDPRVDDLHAELSTIVENATRAGSRTLETFLDVNAAVRSVDRTTVERRLAAMPAPVGSGVDRPRLTEPWYCCAEPTVEMSGPGSRSEQGEPTR